MLAAFRPAHVLSDLPSVRARGHPRLTESVLRVVRCVVRCVLYVVLCSVLCVELCFQCYGLTVKVHLSVSAPARLSFGAQVNDNTIVCRL